MAPSLKLDNLNFHSSYHIYFSILNVSVFFYKPRKDIKNEVRSFKETKV